MNDVNSYKHAKFLGKVVHIDIIIFFLSRGNRTPGSRCNAAVASPGHTVAKLNYCNSFQLTHMPRGSVDREQWRPKGRQDSTHNLASTVSFGM